MPDDKERDRVINLGDLGEVRTWEIRIKDADTGREEVSTFAMVGLPFERFWRTAMEGVMGQAQLSFMLLEDKIIPPEDAE